MSGRNDVVVVGGGHNGLVAATLLARAGLAVTLLEREPRVGGTLATDEIHPGFRAPAAFGGLERIHPSVVAELELERHGLRFLEPRGGTVQLLGAGETLHLDPASGLDAAIAKRAPRDVAAMASFEEMRRTLTGALEPLLVAPLVRQEASVGERLFDLFLFGGVWRALRGLGLEEAMRLLPMNVRDVLDERFESDALKAAIAAPSLQSSFMGPRSAGSFWNLLWHRPAWMPHVLSGPRQVAGGPGAFAAALEASARAAGVVVRTGALVERIATSNGVVRGAVIEGGEEVAAARVISALDPRRTLLGLLEPGVLDIETVTEIGALRGRGNVAIVRLALDRVPRFGDGSVPLTARLQTGASLDDLERAYDASKYGELAERPALEITVPSAADPTLAPANSAVLHVWVQFAPPLAHGGLSWRGRSRRGARADASEAPARENAARGEIERVVLGELEQHAPGISSTVIRSDVLTPAAIEQRFGLTDGSLYHVEPALDQTLWLRPQLGWHLHATPIAGLFLSGPGTHPGGGPTGLPGRCAAHRLLADAGVKRPARLRRSPGA